MNFNIRTVLNWILGWILVIGGLILVPTPILPGWIIVFMGAFLLGWISKRQLAKIKRDLKKGAKDGAKEFIERIEDLNLTIILKWISTVFILILGLMLLPIPIKIGVGIILVGAGLLAVISKKKLRYLRKKLEEEFNKTILKEIKS